MSMTASPMDRAREEAEILCILSLGSNLGDRRGHLTRSVLRLAEARGVRIEALSRVVESEPWGPVPQGRFLNLLARAQVRGVAGDLLAIAQRIEAAAGRDRTVRYGPRTLDIDIIFFGELVLNTPSLTLPHPLWSERPFVRDLLADVLPGGALELTVHPGVREALLTGGKLSPDLREVEPLFPPDRPRGSGDWSGESK